jgi:glucose-1-phosphate thymidylyltransferase
VKGLILAGGAGTRLHPATLAVNKQLLPVYDKPMIYYPLATLMMAGVRDILLISSPDYLSAYQKLLGDGSDWGIHLSFCVQNRPEGLAQAYHLGADFVAGCPSCLILGDNLFFGAGLEAALPQALRRNRGATLFAYRVDHPERYGVVTFDKEGKPLSLVEKPSDPLSQWALTGLYVYDERAADLAATLRPSPRGELEITDLNRLYLEDGSLTVEKLGRGDAWLDTGTHDDLLDASEFVRTMQRRQGILIGCLEEIAFRQGFLSRENLIAAAQRFDKTGYGRYLAKLAEDSQTSD